MEKRSISRNSLCTVKDDLQSCSKGLFADNLGQSKVGYFDAEFLVYEQYVLWLDVSVNNITLMLTVVSKTTFHRYGKQHTRYLMPWKS